MLNNLLKSAKSIKSINKNALKNFCTEAAPAKGNMTERFHDIYIKELQKLEKTK